MMRAVADILDQAHDAVDRFVTKIGNALGVDFDDGSQPSPSECDDADLRPSRTLASRSSTPPALPAPARLALPSGANARWVVAEVDGNAYVTDGSTSQRCPSRAYAQQVVAALNARVSDEAGR